MGVQNLTDKTAARSVKCLEMDELAQVLETLRGEKKKIVHCHGVFDLLHIGHIRHFKQAKNFGDILVVTVTPDHYVNKGPHRPAFSEQLRAEAVAALDDVDYVAVNKWPLAVDTIRLLKPDFYVKGSDYKQADKDVTGGITVEQEAVESVGGQLIFTEDITFSSSTLINRHLPVFSKEVRDYLESFSVRYSAADVIGYLEGIRTLKTLVVGEAIIDEYQYCESIGKSAKEPMIALKRLSTEKFAGGVLAVANHLADFADHVGVLTLLGAENSQEKFIRENMNPKIKAHFLYRNNSPTIVKRRFVENYLFAKLLEIYEINDGALEDEDNHSLCRALREELDDYDAVIVLDFGHSMMTREAIHLLSAEAEFLAVNAQSNAGNMGYNMISKYPRADYICMAEPEARMDARDRRGPLPEIIKDIAGRLSAPRVSITRGKFGCVCYSRDEGFFHAPAVAGQVTDRMGAGDAFLSLTSLCTARKVPAEVVAFIGNAVSAQAVATVGHRKSTERAPLYKQIEALLK